MKGNYHYGAMDKLSVEQWVCGDMAITFVVRKWSHAPSMSGSHGRQAGWLAGQPAVRQHTNEFFFKILYRLKYFIFAMFNKGLVLLQHCSYI